MIQIVLKEEGFPTKEYLEKLSKRLEDLKRMWYKVKQNTEEKGCGKYIKSEDRSCGDCYGYRENEERPYVKKKGNFDKWLCKKCSSKAKTKSGVKE